MTDQLHMLFGSKLIEQEVKLLTKSDVIPNSEDILSDWIAIDVSVATVGSDQSHQHID